MSDYGFMVTQVGEKNSTERARADQVSDYIVAPILAEFGLELQRADREVTPGQITPLILKRLIDSRVVIADLTGRNPNVYYELAIAHAFTKPVIGLIDETRNVAFDTKDERLITLGPYEGGFALAPAEEAKRSLKAALTVVLADGYTASSLVTEVASARSLDSLAPSDPVASELAALRESIEEVRIAVQHTGNALLEPPFDDFDQLTRLVEYFVTQGVSSRAFQAVNTDATSPRFDKWFAATREFVAIKHSNKKSNSGFTAPPPTATSNDPWGENPPKPSSGGESIPLEDWPPF